MMRKRRACEGQWEGGPRRKARAVGQGRIGGMIRKEGTGQVLMGIVGHGFITSGTRRH